MFRTPLAVAALVLVISASSVQAGEKTIVLNVDKATCALCGPIVKGALSKVDGVKNVQIVQGGATASVVATVTFDDALTGVSSLIAATTNAGYPSQLAN